MDVVPLLTSGCRAPWPEWCAKGAIVGQGGSVGLPSDSGLKIVNPATGLEREAAIPIPPDALVVALHSGLRRVACATREGLSVLAFDGTTIAQTPVPLSATTRALSFDSSGRRLWIGLEVADHPRPHVLACADAGTLELEGSVPVEGVYQGYDTIWSHPTRADVVAIVVACGQDGAWLTFAEAGAAGLSILFPGVWSPDHPFSFAGFRQDGSAFACLFEDRVELLAFPTCARIAVHELTDDWIYCITGVFVGNQLLITTNASDTSGEDNKLRALAQTDLSVLHEDRFAALGGGVVRLLPGGLVETQRVIRKDRISPADRKPQEVLWGISRLGLDQPRHSPRPAV